MEDKDLTTENIEGNKEIKKINHREHRGHREKREI